MTRYMYIIHPEATPDSNVCGYDLFTKKALWRTNASIAIRVNVSGIKDLRETAPKSGIYENNSDAKLKELGYTPVIKVVSDWFAEKAFCDTPAEDIHDLLINNGYTFHDHPRGGYYARQKCTNLITRELAAESYRYRRQQEEETVAKINDPVKLLEHQSRKKYAKRLANALQDEYYLYEGLLMQLKEKNDIETLTEIIRALCDKGLPETLPDTPLKHLV